jgi:type IX secretion system PorP/SprF family membrane protein
MLKRILFPVLLFFLTYSGNVCAQDPIFSQFYANPLYLNPAFAGTVRCPRVNLNFRNQWPGIQGTYVTYSASVDRHFDGIHGGLGFIATHDNAGTGVLRTTNISGIYSYQLDITRTFSMKFGFQATYFQKVIDWSKLTFGDMIDARRGFVYTTNEVQKLQSKSGVDFSAGILGYSKKYFFGAALHHITQPDEGLQGPSKLPRKFTAHAGAVIPVGDDKGNETFISPNVLYQQQQDFMQLNLGLYVTKGPFVGGLWYRTGDAFIALIGIHQHSFKIGYSYDVTISKLSNATYGSHEISFCQQFQCKPVKKKFRVISCPSF